MAPTGDEPRSGKPGPAPGGAPGEPKIFVKGDENWKAEAQKEKDRLQEKARAEAREKDLPPASLLALINDLGVQTMLALGLMEVKGAGPRVDLAAARYTIDLLSILEEKTRGNLTAEEKDYLEGLLGNLRLAFARMAKAAGREEKKVVDPGEKKIIY